MTERAAFSPPLAKRGSEGALVPVVTITALIVAIWYLAACR